MKFFKSVFLVCLCLFFAKNSKAQSQSDSLEPLLRQVFEIQEIPGYRFLTVSEVLPDSSHKDFRFISENRLSIDYLYQTVFQPYKKGINFLDYPSTKDAKDAVIGKMLKDSTFLKCFKQLKVPYDNLEKAEVPTQQISKRMLLETGAKFFYAFELDDRGIIWKTCVGGNPFNYEMSLEERLETVLIQAFCIQTIFDNSGPFKRAEFEDSFIKYIDIVQADVKDVKDELKLEEANKRMWPAMAQDEALSKLLLETYHNRKEMLAFRVKE